MGNNRWDCVLMNCLPSVILHRVGLFKSSSRDVFDLQAGMAIEPEESVLQPGEELLTTCTYDSTTRTTVTTFGESTSNEM